VELTLFHGQQRTLGDVFVAFKGHRKPPSAASAALIDFS
jgi:hypothetical protein